MLEFPLEIYNISVVDAPILKDYYWISLKLSRVNEEFFKLAIKKNDDVPEDEPATVTLNTSIMKFPAMPVNSNPMKIVLHLCNNNTEEDVEFNITRNKICNCQIQETQVTFNTYKKLFNCPHRSLLDITPRRGTIKPKESGILILHLLYNLVGIHELVFKMTVNEKFFITLNFTTHILEFEPDKCLITESLFPVQCFNSTSFFQPIWFYNPYSYDLYLNFVTNTKGLRLQYACMYLRRFTIAPFMVKYKPESETCLIEITLIYSGIKSILYLNSYNCAIYKTVPTQSCPKIDIPCPEAPYLIFQNSLTYKLKLNSFSTRMVAVHNYTKEVITCKWLTYDMANYFKIEVSPREFCCKYEHPVLCMVTVYSYCTQSIFHHIPLTCEIHKWKLSPLQNYEKLHSEKESIDDSEIFEPTLLTKIYCNVNLFMEGLRQFDIDLNKCDCELKNINLCQDYDRNCIEKILWNHVFSDEYVYLLGNKNITDYSYGDCSDIKEQNQIDDEEDDKPPEFKHNASIAIMRRLTSNAIEEISKQWRFIPQDFYSPIFY